MLRTHTLDKGDPKVAHARHVDEFDLLEVCRVELRLLHGRLISSREDLKDGDRAPREWLERLADNVLQRRLVLKWP